MISRHRRTGTAPRPRYALPMAARRRPVCQPGSGSAHRLERAMGRFIACKNAGVVAASLQSEATRVGEKLVENA